jgi:hypothetical protein
MLPFGGKFGGIFPGFFPAGKIGLIRTSRKTVLAGPRKIPPVKGGLYHHPEHVRIYFPLIKKGPDGRVFFPHGGKEKMLGSYILFAHAAGFFGGGFQHFPGPLRRRYVAGNPCRGETHRSSGPRFPACEKKVGSTGQAAFKGPPEFPQIDAQKREGLAGGPRAFLKEGYDHMLGLKLSRTAAPRFFLGINGQYTLKTLG